MALVRANDINTRVEFAIEATYGTAPAYPGTVLNAYRRIPFVAETLKLERETLPLSEEFTAFGGLGGVDLGKTRVRGSLTFEPTYDSTWMWALFGSGFGAENLQPDFTIMKAAVTAPAAAVNAHIFNNGTTLISLTILVYKAGRTAFGASTYVDVIKGAYVTKWNWDQPEGNRAKVTLDFIAKSYTTENTSAFNGTGLAIPTAKKVSTQHLGTGANPGLILWGDNAAGVPTNLNLTGFTINCDRKIDDTSGAFLQDILLANDPGIEGTREVTMTLTTNLEDTYGAANKIWAHWLAGTQAAAHILYDQGTEISTAPSSNYGIRFDIPGPVVTDAQNSVSKAGVQQVTVTATCPLAALSRLSTSYDQWSSADTPAIPADNQCDVRVIVPVKVATGGSAGIGEFTDDTKFTGLPDA